MKNKPIPLDLESQRIVAKLIKSGRFVHKAEIVRAALRLLEIKESGKEIPQLRVRWF